MANCAGGAKSGQSFAGKGARDMDNVAMDELDLAGGAVMMRGAEDERRAQCPVEAGP